jgi:uncharacterized protein with PIN domain
MHRVEKDDILEQLEPLTIKYYDEFYRCTDCGRIFWKGTHYERMLRKIAKYSEQWDH